MAFPNISLDLQPLLAGICIAVILVLSALGVFFAPRWRRAAAFRQGQRLLQRGDWRRALRQIDAMHQVRNLSPQWQERLGLAMADCHTAAGREQLGQGDYESALASWTEAAELAHRDSEAARGDVIQAMLQELRRRFTAGKGVPDFVARILKVEPTCAEASFWQALGLLRDGERERAEDVLRRCVRDASAATQSGVGQRAIEPYLYLGTLLLNKGEAREALRLLSEANRIDGNCPLVITQLARAMLASGGDPGIAVRALQRVLGPKGFVQWSDSPHLFWRQGFPAEKSYIHQAAAVNGFTCPLWGKDCDAVHRQARIAYGDGLCRLGQFDQAARVYEKLIHETVPSPDVLCGLGIALAKMHNWDAAFKHLHMAHELENPKTHRTAGYLALCAAMGKPSSPEDKVNNISWAVWLVRGFSRPGDVEWVDLLSHIFAEARASGLTVERDDQIHLCEHLLSVSASDRRAADAIAYLAATHRDAVVPEYAWLYCRAAVQHDVHHDCELELFGRLFRQAEEAREFFAQRDWDFEELEFAFLQRAAERRPGVFPAEMGADYAPRGERQLLQRVDRLQSAGQIDDAVFAAEILVKLAPKCFAGLDRLAQLHFENSNPDRTIELLERWQQLDPSAWLPLARLAAVRQRRGEAGESLAAIQTAMARASGGRRADLAWLGAKMQIACAWQDAHSNAPTELAARFECLRQAKLLLQQCLVDSPDNHKARWCLAAVFLLLNQCDALPDLAEELAQVPGDDPQDRLLAALCGLYAGNYCVAESQCRFTSDDPIWNAELGYLAGWAAIDRGDSQTAFDRFQQAAQEPRAPSHAHARALAGGLAFYLGDANAAIQHWSALSADRRREWGFQQPLAQTIFLAAVEDLQGSRFAEAAGRFRQAGGAGLRDSRLGPLLSAALFQAGRRAADPAQAADFLEQAIRVGKPTPQAQYLLAINFKRQEKRREAREMLRRIEPADSDVFLQLGVLSCLDGDYAQAEGEFARCLELAPQSPAALHNTLICRLSLGDLAKSRELLPRLIGVAQSARDKRLYSVLDALIGSSAGGDAEGDSALDRLFSMTQEEEDSLLQLLQSMPGLDAVFPLFQRFAAARSQSERIKRAYLEIALVRAKELADRCFWREADQLLAPLARELESTVYSVDSMPDNMTVAFWNLLGCCACMVQDFDRAVRCFTTAIKWAGNDPWLYQNLALTCELRGAIDQAQAHWDRYFELLEKHAYVPGDLDYRERLAYAGFNRLADHFNREEKWSQCLGYVQRAHQLRPRDVETLERLFNLYVQVRRPDDARRALRKLREIRPHDPQFELYELDLHEVRTLEDLEWMLGEINRILGRHPGDMRVEDRALAMVANCIPLIGRKSDQLSDQLSHIVEQVRELPNFQINWPVVHDEMHFLRREFQKLRRLSNKCLALVSNEEQRRVIHDLNTHIDSKIDVCISMGG